MFALIVIIGVLLTLVSCTPSPESAILDTAESLLAEQPDSAYLLLAEMDGSLLPVGSKLQARYALLYTQAQYKSYHDPANDSLISIAADYYEEHGNETERFYAYLYQGIIRYLLKDLPKASSSFMRAMANSQTVTDHYSIGQMYSYLSQINSFSHCSDELEYATRAHQEYSLLGKDRYIMNSFLNLSVAQKHRYDYAGCYISIDSCILLANSLKDEVFLAKALAVKADCALHVDSLDYSLSLYKELLSIQVYPLTEVDYGNLAYLFAKRQQPDSARYYLSLAESKIESSDDRTNYWVKSLWVNRTLQDIDKTIESQDSLIVISEKMLAEALSHATIAEQRDYSEMKYNVAEYKSQRKTFVIVAMLLLLFTLGILFITLYRKRQLENKYLQQTIQKLQLEKSRSSEEYENGLQALLHDEFVIQIRDVQHRSGGLSTSELAQLNELFSKKLPHFENALRELTRLSETEWRICMLLKLSCTPGEISYLLNKTPGAISSARIRMFEKVFHRKGSTNDWDQFVEQL